MEGHEVTLSSTAVRQGGGSQIGGYLETLFEDVPTTATGRVVNKKEDSWLAGHRRQIADRVKDRRTELGLSQHDVARLIGVSDKAVQTWERHGEVPWERISQLAGELGVNPTYLATGNDPLQDRVELIVEMLQRLQPRDVREADLEEGSST